MKVAVPRNIVTLLDGTDQRGGSFSTSAGRSLLSHLAVYYAIPVFDVGAKIDSEGGTIRFIQGRVTTLMPGAPCLFCRGRITAERVGIESQRPTDPERAAERTWAGYAPELEDPAPP